MPRTVSKTVAGVTIELENAERSYLPGSIIAGYVVWDPPASSPIAFVRLTLRGRTKTKVVRKGPGGTSTSRGRAQLFDLSQRLYRGEACKNGEHACHFQFTVPTATQRTAITNGDRFKATPGYLSTEDDVSKHELPSTYYYAAATGGVSAEAFMEYVLELETLNSNNISTGPILLPLMIRALSTEYPITTQKLYTRKLAGSFCTHALDPSYDGQPLKFRQKMKEKFRPMTVPRYSYFARIDAPTKIQLDAPEPFPFRVSLIPDLRPEMTTICPDGDVASLPEVKITSFSLTLRSTTLVRCPNLLMDEESEKMHNFEWTFQRPIELTIPVQADNSGSWMIPQKATVSTADNSAVSDNSSTVVGASTNSGQAARPDVTSGQSLTISSAKDQSNCGMLDLGRILGLRLSRLHAYAQEQESLRFTSPIWPSFHHYGINLSYDLIYKMGIECAGKKDTIDNLQYARSPVQVLAPSEADVAKHALLGEGLNEEFDGVGMAWDIGNLAFNIASNLW